MEPMAGLGRPNIVLIVLDSVRADRTDLADASLENAPALYALGKSGAIFTRAYANSTWSLPSHASLFTGLHPHNHGAVNRIVDTIPAADGQTEDTLLVIEPVPLADEHLTLAEFLLSRGYRTAMMAANHGFFSEVFGLLQGFEYVDVRAKNVLALEVVGAPFLRRAPERLETAYRWATRSIIDSHEWVEDALKWIDGRAGDTEPFFLFMNWADAHESRAIAGSPSAPAFPGPERGSFRLYDKALRYQDVALARLIEGLAQRGLTGRTLVIVTSDHGETMGRSGQRHGGPVTQDQIWVPLVIAGATAPRGVIESPVQLADIPVWIRARFGDASGQRLDGTALEDAEAVLATSYFGLGTEPGAARLGTVDVVRPTTWATFRGPWKFVRDARGVEQLFDLNEDPEEKVDLAGRHPDMVALLRQQMDRMLPADLDSWRLEVVRAGQVEKATWERLRNLGYIR